MTKIKVIYICGGCGVTVAVNEPKPEKPCPMCGTLDWRKMKAKDGAK